MSKQLAAGEPKQPHHVQAARTPPPRRGAGARRVPAARAQKRKSAGGRSLLRSAPRRVSALSVWALVSSPKYTLMFRD